MIVVRLAGGLGNQLFQIMAGLLLSCRTGREVLPLSEGLASYQTVQEPQALALVSSPCLVSSRPDSVNRLVRWLSVRARAGRWLPIASVNDRRFPLGVGASHKHCPFIFVDGYFQTGWTWPLLSEASSTLQVVDFPAAPSIAAAHDCIVHIRGGDFLGFESHSFIGTEYYSDAVDRAQACGCRTFGIVSDDYGYAEKLADALQDRHSEAKFSLIQDANDALVDFAILRHARNRIIGNSTFAWWAATLDHEAATTWSPDRFVRSKTRDFFLPHERTISLAGAENRATYIEHDDQTNPLH